MTLLPPLCASLSVSQSLLPEFRDLILAPKIRLVRRVNVGQVKLQRATASKTFVALWTLVDLK